MTFLTFTSKNGLDICDILYREMNSLIHVVKVCCPDKLF